MALLPKTRMKKRMRTTFIHEYQKNPGQSNQPDGFAGPFPAGCPFGYEWLRAFDHGWIKKELTGKDQLKKMLNVHFKTAWKFPETGGKSRQKAERTYSFRKNTGKSRKNGQNLCFGTKRPWGKPPTTSSGGNFVGGFLNRNERSVRWTVATIEVAARSGIPSLRLPEALIFLRFRVFHFPGNCGIFPVCSPQSRLAQRVSLTLQLAACLD